MDISTEAVEVTRELDDEAGLGNRARFVQSDLYELADGSPIDTLILLLL